MKFSMEIKFRSKRVVLFLKSAVSLGSLQAASCTRACIFTKLVSLLHFSTTGLKCYVDPWQGSTYIRT